MEKLKLKYITLQKANAAFNRSIELFNSITPETDLAHLESYSTSLIKHFELFFEVLWKYLKLYLSEKFGTETMGSKTVFRSCLQHGVITESEAKILLDMIEDRNSTAHVYDEKMAKPVCEKIIEHHELIGSMLNRLRI